MINQELVDKVRKAILKSFDTTSFIDTALLQELLDSYTQLIEQNAELHKELHKPKAKLKYGKVWLQNTWWLIDLEEPHKLRMQLLDDLADKIVEGLNNDS